MINKLLFVLGRHFNGVVTRTQAVILLVHDLKVPVPDHVESKICQALKKLEMPDLSHVGISILKKSKAQKEATLADSWKFLTVDSVVTDFHKLKFEVLTPAFESAIESTYFEIVYWKTRIKKVAGKCCVHKYLNKMVKSMTFSFFIYLF